MRALMAGSRTPRRLFPRVFDPARIPEFQDAGDAAIVPLSSPGQLAVLLKNVADEVRNLPLDEHGVSIFQLSGASVEDLQLLVARGCLRQVVDEFGEALFDVAPSGFNVQLSYRVQHAIQESLHDRIVDLDKLNQCSKLELLYLLIHRGWRPVDALPPVAKLFVPGGPYIALLSNLPRSRLYFESLLRFAEILRDGFASISHEGPHSYYLCLQHPELAIAINAIADVKTHKDAYYKQLMIDGGVAPPEALMAIVAGEEPDVGEPLPPVAAPMPPVIIMDIPEAWKTQKLPFPCGGAEIYVNLDGFSHQSGIRRAYCKCPFHESCYKYTHLTSFPTPPQAVAFIVAYIRAGEGLGSKEEHRSCGVFDGDHLLDEMPVLLQSPLILG
jgi:hypothetical protein